MIYPRFIALCGHPGAGKSEVQKILQRAYDYIPVDDGRPLRQIAMQYLGLTKEQVTTQAGKQEIVRINGHDWQVRDVLGEIGNAFEEKFGGDVIPLMSLTGSGILQSVNRERYSFGSVRRQQGWFYKQHGGVVIEIENPDASPSQYEFDAFDRSAVDYVIENDALARGLPVTEALKDLEIKVRRAVIELSLDDVEGAAI